MSGPLTDKNVDIKAGRWLLGGTAGVCIAAAVIGLLHVPVAAIAIVGQTALFAAVILFQDKRRRRAEEQADARETELRAAYDHIRHIGARLVDAQESERCRIARELHDDIGQQLALLATNIRLSADTEDRLAQIDAIARSVREMSHRLHPAMLQLIGLVESVRTLQRDQSRAGIAIAFSHRDIPRELPPQLTLCLFRIVQEALQNAINHARARHVSIDISRLENDLTVTVADDGEGFEVQAACGKGLGLISIIERAEGHGGRVVVQSKPGAGTQIEAHVPLDGHGGRAQRTPVAPSVPCQNRSHYVC